MSHFDVFFFFPPMKEISYYSDNVISVGLVGFIEGETFMKLTYQYA